MFLLFPSFLPSSLLAISPSNMRTFFLMQRSVNRDTSGTLLAYGLYCKGFSAAVVGVSCACCARSPLPGSDGCSLCRGYIIFSRSALVLFLELLFPNARKRGERSFLLFCLSMTRREVLFGRIVVLADDLE
ncbi:hypothetical protein DFH94DRAFT_752253 [Russula ochroleuca]|uniref:Secreted protein n=1 Tax=Russula ochroleuca TaxID=152965 RepID=A0A9P5T7B7_9AGAM|nr:hypothetical protein DFH94DRAFT_752253 [Russula ochroleuca]